MKFSTLISLLELIGIAALLAVLLSAGNRAMQEHADKQEIARLQAKSPAGCGSCRLSRELKKQAAQAAKEQQ